MIHHPSSFTPFTIHKLHLDGCYVVKCIIYSYITLIGERAKRARHSQVCSIEIADIYIIYILGKWLPLESELESFPIFFSSSIALLSSLLSCNFYLLDLKTIVDILEMT